MQENQVTGIDLPMKALAWEDENGEVWVTYPDAGWIGARHGLGAELGRGDRRDPLGHVEGDHAGGGNMRVGCACHGHGRAWPALAGRRSGHRASLGGRDARAHPAAHRHRADQALPAGAVAAHRPRVPLPADLLRIHGGGDRPLRPVGRVLDRARAHPALRSVRRLGVRPGAGGAAGQAPTGTRRGATGGGPGGTSTRRPGSTCR